MTTYISIFTDEAQNCVNADESPRPTDACAAVCDDGAGSMNVSHEGDEREQLFWLRGCAVVWPPRVVQMCDELRFISLRKQEHLFNKLRL